MQNIPNNTAPFIMESTMYLLIFAILFYFREINFNIPKQNSSINCCLYEKYKVHQGFNHIRRFAVSLKSAFTLNGQGMWDGQDFRYPITQWGFSN